MMWGVPNLKDVLHVAIIPVISLALGASLPLLLERGKAKGLPELDSP
jgi:hypothetical protein